MLLNTKCERCNEPTKHVVGFWMEKTEKAALYMIARMRNAKYGN